MFVKRWNIISFFLVIIGLIMFFIFVENTKDDNCRKTAIYYNNMQIEGVIIDKFIDYNNHAEKTIKINSYDSILIYRKYKDVSGLYEFVQSDDSIVKKSGSMEVKVIRINREYLFQIDFDCENH